MAFQANSLVRIRGKVSCVIGQHIAVCLAEFRHVEVEVEDSGVKCSCCYAFFGSGGSSTCLGFQLLCATGGCIDTRFGFGYYFVARFLAG